MLNLKYISSDILNTRILPVSNHQHKLYH